MSARVSRVGCGVSPQQSSEPSGKVRAGETPSPTPETGPFSGITALGRRMLAFPIHPRYARMLLAAQEYRCVPSIALIAALTQGRNLLRRLDGKQAREDREDVLGDDTDSDFFILMRAFRYAENSRFDSQRCARLGIIPGAAREAAQLSEQFLAIARDEGLDLQNTEVKPGAIQRCVLAGFPIRSQSVWMPEPCAAAWSTDGTASWPGKARSTARGCWWPRKSGKSKAATGSVRFF